MKITVKKADISIIVDESESLNNEKKTSLKWSDQCKLIQETIIVMVEQCIKLKDRD